MPRSRVRDEPDAVEVVSFLARSDGGTGTGTVASAVAASDDRDDRDDDDGRLGTLLAAGGTTTLFSPSSERWSRFSLRFGALADMLCRVLCIYESSPQKAGTTARSLPF